MTTIFLSFMICVFPEVGIQVLYEPDHEQLYTFDVSSDLQHWWAIGYQPGYGYRMIVDGKSYDWFEEEIDKFRVILSNDYDQVAFVAPYNGREMVVWNNVAQNEYDQVCGEYEMPLFSPDGQHLAYSAFDGEQWVVVHDGKASPGFEGIQAPTFSNDSKHWAFAGKKAERWSLVLDGKVKAEHDYIEAVRFLPDGSLHYVCADDDRWILVRGSKKSPSYEEISETTVSKDGKHYAYACRTGEKWRAVHDGKEGTEYDNVKNLTLTPSGGHIAYAAGKGSWTYDGYFQYYRFDGSYTMVLDRRELLGGPEDYDIENITFSPDEAQIAYTIGKIGEQEYLVVDTTAYPAFHGITRLVGATAANRLAYSVYDEDDRHSVIAGDQRFGPYDYVDDLGLSADGSHVVAAVQEDGKWYVMIDGKLQDPFDRISWLRWAADRRSVGAIGVRDKALCRAVYAVQ